jgi:hypothetical protein
MPQMQNRVQETTTTGGTGTLTLSGAVTGYITFASGFSTGASLFYTVDNGVGEWEIGIGTLVTTGTLSRTTVIASSNSGALVNFSSGTKRVFCSAPTRSLVPDQDSNSGKVLTTDGTNPAWTQTLNGITIGNLTAAAGAFTTLSASSTVSGTGFSTYLASPPAIGGSSPAAGNFTTLSSSSTTTVGTNLVFSGTGNRITGDFSNATVANRVAFQSSTTNGNTQITVFPNGTATNAGFDCYSNSDPTNTSRGLIRVDTAGGDFKIDSTRTGTGTFLAMTFFTGGSERVRISTAGVVTIGSAISLDPTTANALVVNSSGNVGIGVTPSAWGGNTSRALEFANGVALLGNLSVPAAYLVTNVYSANGGSVWTYKTSAPATLYLQNGGAHLWYNAPSGTAGNTATFTSAMTLTAAGDFISTVNGTAPSLSTNGTMVFALTSNTNLRISVRGTDGTTRVANITLA